jgi:hypothetical protein
LLSIKYFLCRDLIADPYLNNILSQIAPNVEEIEIKPDGTWCTVDKKPIITSPFAISRKRKGHNMNFVKQY